MAEPKWVTKMRNDILRLTAARDAALREVKVLEHILSLVIEHGFMQEAGLAYLRRQAEAELVKEAPDAGNG